jgi:uncharacterized protein (TIGR01777 family)
MKVVITGGTGLVGSRLISRLRADGHHVGVFSRSSKSALDGVELLAWPADARGKQAVAEADVVFNLAGAPVAQRWTKPAKAAILNSRVDVTDAIVRLMNPNKIQTLVSASAVGIYPEGDGVMDENTPPDRGFLADVVRAWENSARKAEQSGHRVVCLRIGLVLAPEGGALAKLLPVFKLGLGSPVGTGEHWQSWIHIDDLVNLFVFSAQNGTMSGAYNAVAPHSVTNRVLSHELAKALKRPFFFPPVPAFVLKAMFGEMAQVILASQRVNNVRVNTAGFQYKHPEIGAAMRQLFA